MFKEGAIVQLVSIHDSAINSSFANNDEAAAKAKAYMRSFDVRELPTEGATIYHCRMLGALDFAELESPHQPTARAAAAAKIAIFERCIAKVTRAGEELEREELPPLAVLDIGSQCYQLHGSGSSGPLS